MIVSTNPEPNRDVFDGLLLSMLDELGLLAKTKGETIKDNTGSKFEPFVKEVLDTLAVGTPFENTIEFISGQRFPDIIANKFYGIEVKTTTQNHWKTTGNSVLESTRVDGVERIFMLFAKLANPIAFKCRPYEECLSEVVVTHSPRYLIDMELKVGATIFDKIDLPYDVLRKKENPIKPIVDYYKSQLKPGEELWWIDQNSTKSSSLIIKLWNHLSIAEKELIKHKALAYFPELFSNRSDKFGRLAVWLVTEEAIVCPNIRDLFTAGGKGTFIVGDETYQNVPRIVLNLFENIKEAVAIIKDASPDELTEFWGHKTTESRKLLDWVDLVATQISKIWPTSVDAISQLLLAKIDENLL